MARGERVLVVEDDPGVLKLAVSLLASLGYRTAEAEDGEVALDILSAGPKVDLLLTDIVMPGERQHPSMRRVSVYQMDHKYSLTERGTGQAGI